VSVRKWQKTLGGYFFCSTLYVQLPEKTVPKMTYYVGQDIEPYSLTHSVT